LARGGDAWNSGGQLEGHHNDGTFHEAHRSKVFTFEGESDRFAQVARGGTQRYAAVESAAVNAKALQQVLFIDDGGVMNDNSVRQGEWRRLVGEFMPQHLGGEPHQWAEANIVTFPPMWESLVPRLDTFTSHAAFQREYDLAWLRGMCDYIGIAMPEDGPALRITREASLYISSRARSAFPGASEAVRTLHDAGYELHTASGESSWELHGYLSGMGVRDCFGTLFGPDLVDVMKAGPEYYRRMFAFAGVDPADALVIDDSESAAGWAREAGANALRIGEDAKSLAELVAARLT
jgi:phosphoglycolate phosphatase-like HAD superfamily hydrolase